MTATQIPEFTLGDRLRKAREHAGLRQEEMADILGVSPATVSNWENGARRPKNGELELINRWAEETCVPAEWLAGFRIGCLPPGVFDLNGALDRSRQDVQTDASFSFPFEPLGRAA